MMVIAIAAIVGMVIGGVVAASACIGAMNDIFRR